MAPSLTAMSNAESCPGNNSGFAVLSALLQENHRYAGGKAHPTECTDRALRERLARDGQTPLAAVIACADSRVPPELLFRAKLGDLFVIRAAGNTPWGAEVAGSVEYAVDHLHVPLVIVLGHTGCGAVKAACSGGDPLPGPLGLHITAIAKRIQARSAASRDPVHCNVLAGVDALHCEDAAECICAAEKRGVVVVGAVYDMNTGLVSVVEDDQSATVPTTPTLVNTNCIEQTATAAV